MTELDRCIKVLSNPTWDEVSTSTVEDFLKADISCMTDIELQLLWDEWNRVHKYGFRYNMRDVATYIILNHDDYIIADRLMVVSHDDGYLKIDFDLMLVSWLTHDDEMICEHIAIEAAKIKELIGEHLS